MIKIVNRDQLKESSLSCLDFKLRCEQVAFSSQNSKMSICLVLATKWSDDIKYLIVIFIDVGLYQLVLLTFYYYIFVKMRYEARTYRSQSYLLREGKQNKENANVNNIYPNKLRPKELFNCLPKLESKVSESTSAATLVSSYLKKDNLPEQLKKTYSLLVAKDYSNDIMNYYIQKSTTTQGFLDKHAITPTLRSKMVDWMIQVLSSYKMTEETFFRSVKMMDLFLKKSEVRQQLKDLHLIGVTVMFSAAKYEEIHPLKLNVMYDKIARKKFRKSQILDKQSEIVNVLDFKLEDVTVYDIVRHAALEINLQLSESLQKYFDQIILYLSKMTLFNHQLAEENVSLLAGAVFFIGLKTLEQVECKIQPEKKLGQISRILQIQEDHVLEVSRKVLDLAKNFSKIYPTLLNLKKFNKFQYNQE